MGGKDVEAMPKVSRTRRKREHEAAAALHKDMSARKKIGYTAAYRKWLIRRIIGFSLIGIGAGMAAVHVVVHLGGLQFLPTLGLQDLLTGYPMAGLLAVAGGVIVSRR